MVRYVGYTAQSKNKRLSAHLCEWRTGKRTHKNNWIKKLHSLGLCPTEETLDTATTLDELKQLEIYWIAQFRAWGFNLVNTTSGGEGVHFLNGHNPWKGRRHSEETKKKLSSIKIGKFTDKQRDALKTRNNVGMTGKHHSIKTKGTLSLSHRRENLSTETIEKMRLAKLGKPGNRLGKSGRAIGEKSVNQIKDGKIINTWKSLSEAANQQNFSISLLSLCCNSKRRSAYGFTWKFTTDRNDIT